MEYQVENRFSRRHPLICGIFVAIIFMLSINIPAVLLSLFGHPFFLNNGDFLLQGTVESVGSLVAILLVSAFGYGKIWSEKGTGFAKGLDCSAYFLLMSFLSLFSVGLMLLSEDQLPETEPAWKIAVFVVTILLIGFAEETYFRGIISNLFLDKHGSDPAGVWCAVIGSGFVFGLMHLINILGSDPVGVLVQTFSACMMGMALTAIYYRCRNIWVLIFVHAFVNFCGAFTAGVFSGGSLSGTISSYAPEQLVSALPYLIVTLVLLRPSKMRQIIALHNGVDALQLPEKLESSKRSKLSRGIAVAAAVIISIAVIAGCYYFSFERVVISYSRSDTWNGEDSFSEVTDSFTVDETGYYTYTFSSYSSSSSAVTIFNVYENGILIYSAECQGNGSYSINIEMYDTSTYAVEFVYDYSRVEDRSESYQTSLDVVKAF